MSIIYKFFLKIIIKNLVISLNKIFYINSFYQNSILSNKEKTSIALSSFFPKLFKIQFNNKDFTGLNPETFFTFNEIFNTNMYLFKTNSIEPFIIDCGTNIGISVLYFKKLYPKAKIVCFEPDDNNYDILLKNINHQSWNKSVVVHKKGVSDKNGFANFSNEGHAGSKILENEEDGNFKIEIIDLIEFIENQNENISFLKLDVEGAEFQIIPKLNKVAHKIERIYIEFHYDNNNYLNFINYIEKYFSEDFNYSMDVNFSKIEKPFINMSEKNYDTSTYYNFYGVNKNLKS